MSRRCLEKVPIPQGGRKRKCRPDIAACARKAALFECSSWQKGDPTWRGGDYRSDAVLSDALPRLERVHHQFSQAQGCLPACLFLCVIAAPFDKCLALEQAPAVEVALVPEGLLPYELGFAAGGGHIYDCTLQDHPRVSRTSGEWRRRNFKSPRTDSKPSSGWCMPKHQGGRKCGRLQLLLCLYRAMAMLEQFPLAPGRSTLSGYISWEGCLALLEQTKQTLLSTGATTSSATLAETGHLLLFQANKQASRRAGKSTRG